MLYRTEPFQLALGGGGLAQTPYKAAGFIATGTNAGTCQVLDIQDSSSSGTPNYLYVPPFLDLAIPGSLPLSGTYRLVHVGGGQYQLQRCVTQTCDEAGNDFGWQIVVYPLNMNPQPPPSGIEQYCGGVTDLTPQWVYALKVSWEMDTCPLSGSTYPAPAGIYAQTGYWDGCVNGVWATAPRGQGSNTFAGLLGLLTGGLTFKSLFTWNPTPYLNDTLSGFCQLMTAVGCPQAPNSLGISCPLTASVMIESNGDPFSPLYDGATAAPPANLSVQDVIDYCCDHQPPSSSGVSVPACPARMVATARSFPRVRPSISVASKSSSRA